MNIWTKLAMFSFFETERLYLRPFFFSDSKAFYEIASNPENLQFIFPCQASLEESQYALANYFMKAPLGVWAICSQDNQEMIGSIITHLENQASQKVAQKAGFSLFRQFKGSDRYTRKMRDYLEFRYVKGEFSE